MRTKAEASTDLCITDRKRQRLCDKLFHELSQHGYDRHSKFINDNCFALLKAYIDGENEAKNYIRIISKSSLAKRLNISSKTLSNWMHRPQIFEKLVAVGYEKHKKKLTIIEYNILAKHIDL